MRPITLATLVMAAILICQCWHTPVAAQDRAYHVVKKGDTLWDISKHYFNDPFKWPGLWKENRHIENPHLIYPGDIIRLIPEDEAIAEGLPHRNISEAAKEGAPITPLFAFHGMARAGFIAKQPPQGVGKIIRAERKKLLLAKGDRVFVMPRDEPFTEGQRFIAYRKRNDVVHPATEQELGTIYETTGVLRILKEGQPAQALIEDSFSEIEVGSSFMAYRELPVAIPLKAKAEKAEGMIVANIDGKQELASYDIIYVDIGSDNGIKGGELLKIYHPREPITDPDTEESTPIPPELVGIALVIEPQEQTATAIIIKSLREIRIGDRVETTDFEGVKNLL